MSADAKTDKRDLQTDEPAKGGTKPAHQKPYQSGDSLKSQGDKLQHAVDDAAKRKND